MATATANINAEVFEDVLDPHAAWILLLDAFASGHWRVVRTQAEDLLGWMDLGGEPPYFCGKITDRSWNRHMVRHACKLARLIARRRLRG